jgi:hypothetical protein
LFPSPPLYSPFRILFSSTTQIHFLLRQAMGWFYIYLSLSLGAGVAQSVGLYWLQIERPGFDSRQKQRIYPLVCVQIGSGAHPASYPTGTGGPFPGGKERSGHDADHSPPSSAEGQWVWELYSSPLSPAWR